MIVTVSREAHFNAAHRLHNVDWDAKTNQRVFGKCNNPNGHGHNYVVHAHVTGEINLDTGYVIDMKDLKRIMKEEIEFPFDHKHLNLDVEDFYNLNPTAENIAVVIWNRMRPRLGEELGLEITLYETERNYVKYNGK